MGYLMGLASVGGMEYLAIVGLCYGAIYLVAMVANMRDM